MEVYVHYKELSKLEIKKQLKDDSARYSGWSCSKIGNPTNKMDCAGYTYNNMFPMAGEYWITAGVFYQNLILPFGKQISDRRTWGDARPNDIVVFKNGGEAKHISYISKVEKTLGQVTSITIVTKDGKEGIYSHKMGFFLNDEKTELNPLVQSLGYPYVYRLNYGNFDINEDFYKDCLTPPKEPANIYKLKEIIVDSSEGYAEKRINATEYYYARRYGNNDEKKYSFLMKRTGDMPETIEPGGTFEMPMMLETTHDDPSFDDGVMVSWYCDEQYLWKNSADKHLWVGKLGNKIQKNINEKITIAIPDCKPKKLICCFKRAKGFSLGEGQWINWLQFVYEQQ